MAPELEPTKSESDLLYFLHIPKTSGTSLSEFLFSHFDPAEALPPMLWDRLVQSEEVITPNTRLIVGHFAGILPLWLNRWPTILTMLREPISRALSHINHVQRESTEHPLFDLARGLSIEEICAHPKLRPCVDNLQSRYIASLSFSLSLVRTSPALINPTSTCDSALAFEYSLLSLDSANDLAQSAIQALKYIDILGITEYHAASTHLICKHRDWSVASAQTIVRNVAASNQKSRDSLTNSEVEALKAVNGADLELYAFARERFFHECELLGISVTPGSLQDHKERARQAA